MLQTSFRQIIISFIANVIPILNYSDSLQNNLLQVVGALRCHLPINSMALLRLDNQGRVRELACWSEDPLLCEEKFRNRLADWGEGLTESLRNSSWERAAMPLADEWREIRRTLILPLMQADILQGTAFFNKPSEAGDWSGSERHLLQLAVTLLSLFLAGKAYAESLLFQDGLLKAALDQARIYIQITDPRTDEILYMNRPMKELFHLNAPEGSPCWKVLQADKQRRCQFCPVEHLTKYPDNLSVYRWEGCNELTDRIFEYYDSLLRGPNGSMVHLQQSFDVTDSRRLSAEASIDELTGLRNRRAGQAALAQALEESRTGDTSLIVCLFDVNFLKNINDTFGHLEGDRAICLVSQCVGSSLRHPDFCFRLGGDEFVAVFHNRNRYAAVAHMKQALRELKRQKQQLEISYRVEFCFGCFEVPPGHDFTLSAVLSKADEEMYERKKQFHIREAQRRLMEPAASGVQTDLFSGDTMRLYKALSKSTDAYIYIADMKTGTFRYSGAMVTEFGLPGEMVKNAAAVWGEKIHPEDKAAFLEANQIIADGRSDSHCVEYRAKNQRGEWVWVRCRGYLERDASGEPRLFAGLITNLGQKNKIDHLTGLGNKIKFAEDIQTVLQRRPVRPMRLLLAEPDGFPLIHELYTRLFGDEVLRIMAQRIQSMLPPHATVYRLNGNEFGIIVDGGTDEAQDIYRSIAGSFDYPQQYDGKEYFCPLSAGCASYPEDGTDYPTLLQHAGCALHRAKSYGKSRLTVFQREMAEGQQRSLKLLERLRESAEHHFAEFDIVYQPQVRANDGSLIGAEALARWKCGEYGSIAPAEFIPLLEQSGLIQAFGKWAFRQAAVQCREWVRLSPDFTMGINISSHQATTEMLPFIRRTLKELDLEPANMTLEFPVSSLTHPCTHSHDFFEKLRTLGICIAINDFGTGHASPRILKTSRFDIVKVGPPFLRNILTDAFDATFIRCIVELCHTVGTAVCLQGVEQEAEWRKVLSLHPDRLQGFFFGRPMAADVFTRTLLS